MTGVRLNPTNDLVFKLLLVSDQALLVDMIEAVLDPPSPIESLEVLDPEIPGDLTGDKAIRLDVRARFRDGSLVDVEMQAQGRPAFPSRLLFYWGRNYTDTLARGQEYSALRPAVSVVWCTSTVVPTGRFHNTFLALEKSCGYPLSDHFQIHVLQLPHLSEALDVSLRLQRWARFLGASTDQEFDTLAKEDPIMAQAVQDLDKLSLDPQARRRAQAREDDLRMYRNSLVESRLEGEAKGRAETVLKVLTYRFGPVSESLAAKVRAASVDVLDEYTLRAVTAKSLDEVLE
ncbi:MAG: Rpn family recombination-promoting nuclease/putative transposase [Polyangiaceae bacterium]|nr:Rpn family recombination-promoting nuclease/putative transposase [Polyangiaceae bacterium]